MTKLPTKERYRAEDAYVAAPPYMANLVDAVQEIRGPLPLPNALAVAKRIIKNAPDLQAAIIGGKTITRGAITSAVLKHYGENAE